MPVEMPTQTPEVAIRPTVDLEFIVVSDEDLEKPFRVIIQNDDVTPMDFVVAVLVTIFERSVDQAYDVMYDAHHNGQALVVVLPLKVAQDRVYAAQSVARDAGYPLSFYLEPDE